MLNRPRTWLAAPGALLLVLAVSGAVLGATVLVTGPAAEEITDPPVVDTSATWEDVDGNGIDDDCQDGEATVDADAALAAFVAADTDGNGTISVEEAAHSEWVGGANCNHGGVVSFVAGQQDADEDADEDEDAEAPEDTEEAPAEAEACVATVVEPFDPTTMTFGEYVSTVAQSDAEGGKNCNHGGAVSEAVHAAQVLAKEARETAKAERAAERAAAKAERDSAKAAAKTEREAAKAAKPNKGKHGG
jgi:hypothetical protein